MLSKRLPLDDLNKSMTRSQAQEKTQPKQLPYLTIPNNWYLVIIILIYIFVYS